MSQERPTKIARIAYWLRRLVSSPQAGEWRSHIHGSGLDFDQITPYHIGDEVRRINWAATARHGGQRTFKNAFFAERESTMMVLVDLSRSMAFGVQRLPKRTLAAELTACLVYSALHYGDRIGLIGFTDCVELLYPPRRSRAYLTQLPAALVDHPLSGDGADLSEAFQGLSSLRRHGCLVFILSDFYVDLRVVQTCLATASRHHEVIPIVLYDPLEKRWPKKRGALSIEDLETGQRRRLYLSASFGCEAEQLATAHHERVARLFQELGLPWASIHQRDDYPRKIAGLFMERKHQRR